VLVVEVDPTRCDEVEDIDDCAYVLALWLE